MVRPEGPPVHKPAPRLVQTDGSRATRCLGDTNPRCNPRPGRHLEEGDEASTIRALTHLAQLRLALLIKTGPARDPPERHRLLHIAAHLEPQPESIQIGYPRSHRPVLIPAGPHTDTGDLLCPTAGMVDLRRVAPDRDHRLVTSQARRPAMLTPRWHQPARTACDPAAGASLRASTAPSSRRRPPCQTRRAPPAASASAPPSRGQTCRY